MATHYCSRCLTTFSGIPERCPNLSCGKGPPSDGWGSVLGEADLLDRHYLIDKVLAIGGAGLTYLAREVDDDGGPTGPKLAIKVLYTQRDAGPFLRRLSNEAQILQDLDHPHIVKCRGFVHRTGKAPYLVTLFEEGGALTDFVEGAGGLPPKVAAGVLKQILLALDMAHEKGVVHRDLKPDNVLLHALVDPTETPLIRVADFGIAKVFGGVGDQLTRIGSFIGTPEYAAPEQFEGVTPTPATDVFAAGGVLYYLITGEPPLKFTHRHDIDASHDELLKQLPPQLPTTAGDSMTMGVLQEVINWTMTLRPGDRWTISQVLARLNLVIEGKVAEAYTDQGAPRRAVSPTNTFVPQRTDEVGRRTIERPDGKTLSGGPAHTNSDHGSPRPPRQPWEDKAEAPPVPSKPSGKAQDTWRVDQDELEEMRKDVQVAPSEPPPPPPVQRVPPPPPEPPPPPPEPPPPPPPPEPRPHVDEARPPQASSPSAARSGSSTPTAEPSSSGGGKGLLAAGGAVFLVGGGALVLVVVLLVVWQMGLFGGGGSIELADPAHKAERAGVQEVLDRAGADIAKLCGDAGDVKVALTIGASGQVTEAAVDPSSVEADELDCLTGAFGKLVLPRTSGGEARMRATVGVE